METGMHQGAWESPIHQELPVNLEQASDQWRLTVHPLLVSKASVASHGQVKTLVLSYKPSTPRPPCLCSSIMLVFQPVPLTRKAVAMAP